MSTEPTTMGSGVRKGSEIASGLQSSLSKGSATGCRAEMTVALVR